MRPRPNIQDIAKRAGVSPTTVSHVLNRVESARIADATRARVEEVVREMGYRPNGLARSLRTQRSNTLALLSEDIATTPYAGRLILGAQEAASRQGCVLMVMTSGGDPVVEEREIEAIVDHQVDGVLYATSHHSVVRVPLSLADKAVVIVNSEAADRRQPAVYPDEFQGGYAATRELLDAGHRSIAFVNTREPILARQGRLRGYRAALKEAGVPFRARLVAEGGEGSFARDGYEAARPLLRDHRPTAVFCFNDRMAMGVYRAAREAGLSIPDDLSIVGFDNQDIIAEALAPTLTTMDLPYYQMGASAVDELLARIRGDSSGPRRIAIPSDVVRRESVRQLVTP